MHKKIILIIIVLAVIALITFGQIIGLNQVFSEDIPHFYVWVFTALAVIISACLLLRRFPLFSRIILIIAGAVFPAAAIAVLVTFLMLIIYSSMRGNSVACDMGGGGIISLILGMFSGAVAYLLILIIGIPTVIFKHQKKK